MNKSWLLLGVILALTAAVYASSLRGEFVWDDRALVLDDEQLRSFANVPRLFARDFFAPGQDDFKYGYYRPLITLSYMLDWSLWRDRPLGYRLTNLLWHLLAVALLFILVRRLAPDSPVAAPLAAGLFALHPIHAESVAWIAGRTDVLCAVFALGSLLAWHRYLQAPATDPKAKKKTAPAVKRDWRWLALAAFSFFLSLLAKEMGVVVLPAAWAMTWLFPAPAQKKSFPLAPTVAFAAALALYLVLRLAVAGVTTESPSSSHSLLRALMTFPGAFALYLGKLFYPGQLSSYWAHPYANHPFHPTGLMGLLDLTGILVLLRALRKSDPLLSFALAAFLASFLPLANLLRISAPADMGFVMAERFLYLPSAFFCLTIALAASRLYRRRRAAAWAVTGLLALLIALGGVRTVSAAAVWRDEVRMYENALEQAPAAPLLWANLGAAYRRLGRLENALDALHKAESFNRQNPSADPIALYNNLGTALATSGKLEEALAAFDRSLSFGGQQDRVQFNRGEALRLLGRIDEALAAYNASIRSNPAYADPRLRRAQIALGKGDLATAEADLREVLRGDPRNPDAMTGLGHLLRRTDKMDAAADLFGQVVALRPDDYSTWLALGGVEGQRGRYPEAIAAFEKARALRPNEPQPIAALAAALFRAGERERVRTLLDEGWARFPQSAELALGLLNYTYETGDRDQAKQWLAQAAALAPDHPQVVQYQKAFAEQP